MTDRANIDVLVLGAVITGLVTLLGVLVLSNAAPLAPDAGEPFYRGGQAFEDGLVAAFILLVVGGPSAYLYLLRGR